LTYTLDDYLAQHNLKLGTVCEVVRRQLNVADADLIFIAGSLVEGLGNKRSDLDIYWVTDGRPAFTKQSLPVGSCVADVQILPAQSVEELVRRFAAWLGAEDGDPRHFTPRDRLQLHRLLNCVAIQSRGRLESLIKTITKESLARHKVALSKVEAFNLHLDLVGLLEEGKYYSLIGAAQFLLGYAIDTLVAAYGFTNPNPKWRIELFNSLPTAWEERLPGRSLHLQPDRFWLEHNRPPVKADPKACEKYVERITTFSRNVHAWATWLLTDAKSATAYPPAGPTPGRKSPKLPKLKMDVVAEYRADQFYIYAVSNPTSYAQVSPAAWRVISLFDGVSPRSGALELLTASSADARLTLNALILLTDKAGLLDSRA
jgi:hypothetical protein